MKRMWRKLGRSGEAKYGYTDPRPRNWHGEVIHPECRLCPPHAREEVRR